MNRHFSLSGVRLAVLLAACLWAGLAAAQEGVRLSALPSAEMSRGLKPLPPARGFNAANARAAALAPQRRAVTRTVAVTRTQLLPAPGAGSSQAEMLQYRASGLRLIGSASLENLRNVLTGDEQRAAAGLLTVTDPIEGRQLARFLGQTTQYVSVNGDTALVGWWHALDDAWIVSRWRNENGTWRIATMGALLGGDLAANAAPASGDVPLDWARNFKGLAATLETHNQAGIRNFMSAARGGGIENLLTNSSRQARAWKSIRDRRALQEGILARAAQSPGFGDIRKIVSQAVGQRPAKDIAADRETRARLAALPANARATMRPIMAVQHPDGKTFLVQSPLAPAFLALVWAPNPPDTANAGTANATVRPTEFQAFSLWVKDSQ